MSDHDDNLFSDDFQPSGPPEGWSPDWGRWQAMVRRGRELARDRKKLIDRQAELEAELEERTGERDTLTSTLETERSEWAGQREGLEIQGIDGLVEPDVELFRSKWRAAVADQAEAERPSLVDWMHGQVSAAVENPEDAPRWMRGYVGEQQPAATTRTEPKPPPSDSMRRSPPLPSGGYTAEQIEAMSPAEYAEHKPAIMAQMGDGGRG